MDSELELEKRRKKNRRDPESKITEDMLETIDDKSID